MKVVAILGLAVSIMTAACGPNQRILNSASENPAARSEGPDANTTPAETTVEQDIEAMRTADFNFIYVFRRRDGAALDADDTAFFSRTTPAEMNRRRLSDGGRALIIGSNFRMPPENIEELKARFVFEDHSRVGSAQ
jgi:hypothetical protein